MNLTCFIISCKIQTWFCHGNSLLITFIQTRNTMLWSGPAMHISKNYVKKLKINPQNQSVSKQLDEWGINLSPRNKRSTSLLPFGFLWRLTFLNTLIIVIATVFSGWAIYNTACFVAGNVGDFDAVRQQHFNRTLFGYLWIFMLIAAITASVLHFFLTKRLIKPIRHLIESTLQMKQGHYPEPIKVYKNDEIGQLVLQYNGLIEQLQTNEQQRKRLVSDLSHEIR